MGARAALWMSTLCLSLLVGCNAAAPTRGFTGRALTQADPDEVFEAGRMLLLERFERLALVDGGGRKIVTMPIEFTTKTESGTARDLRRGRTAMRRTATFLVGQRDGEVLARLRIDIERQDAERTAQLARPSMAVTDYPGDETATQRDAATSVEQNSVWVKVRRDVELENELLAQLVAPFESVPRGVGE